MKVAIIHDWLTGLRGGEKCLLAFLALYPEADIFTLLHVPGMTHPEIDKRVKKTSWLNSVPGIRKTYRYFLPLYPLALKSFDLSGYDLVISLSHAVAKNVSVPKGVPHICYCFTPMRYVWDQIWPYFGEASYVLYPVLMLLRGWDKRRAQNVTHFVAISRFVAARIRRFYGRRATIIYPPVDTAWLDIAIPAASEGAHLQHLQQPAFLCAGALVPYKRIDIAIEVFNELGLPLWIIGDGPEKENLMRKAKSNVTFFGRASDGFLAAALKKSRALVFPGIEDFGMIPVESLAAGTPVIAVGKGGVQETLAPGVSTQKFGDQYGVLYRSRGDQKQALTEALGFFLANHQTFSAQLAQKRARDFSFQEFCNDWSRLCSDIQLLDRTGLKPVYSDFPAPFAEAANNR